LQNIQDKYYDYLRKQDDFPVLVLDITRVDFVLDRNIYQYIKKIIMIPYEKAMHRKVL
jgi:deoxyadenosine/deoxycytidine kinase